MSAQSTMPQAKRRPLAVGAAKPTEELLCGSCGACMALLWRAGDCPIRESDAPVWTVFVADRPGKPKVVIYRRLPESVVCDYCHATSAVAPAQVK